MAVKKKARSKAKQKPKPVIEYPPVPTKKWIPPDKRPKKEKPAPKYQKPEGIHQKLKISSLKRIWNQFVIYGNTGVLLGHFSQTNKRYTFKTNGYQGACNCAVACTFAYIYKMRKWNQSYLDRILDIGDDLYTKSTQQENGRCLTIVPPEQVFNSFYLNRTKVLLNINVGPKISQVLPSVTDQKVKEFISRAVEDFFKVYASGIFALKEKYLALWIQEDAYYMFDPTDHDEYGNAWKDVVGEGMSVILRSNTLEDMVENICSNVNAKVPHTRFEIIQCTVSRITNIQTSPPATFEEFMKTDPVEMMGIGPEETETEEIKPVDVLTEKLKTYMDIERKEASPLKTKLEEISPEVTEELSPSRRPSWLQGAVDKNDMCMFPIPHKPQLDRISFYIEIQPERLQILQGQTCQTDSKFSKYEGRQSMGNAISALIMLRFHKSKLWVPRLVNTILKYGDLLYRDAMISIPRTQSLKLSNFQRKTEYEKRNFTPVVEEYVVVGKLQSLEYDVLDLYPALDNFLIDNESCVIQGPITLAVWTEDEFYYWFDPNERDKFGKAIVKCKTGGELGQSDYTPGVACVIQFAYLKDLVELYMHNVEKTHKFDPFYLSTVKIKDYVEIPDPWYNFKGLIPGKWILRGTLMQASKKFPKGSRNFQSPANSLAALAFQSLVPEKDWTTEIIDEVLKVGDLLYNQSVEYLMNTDKFISKLLTISEVNPDVEIREKRAVFEVGECAVCGIINARKDDELKNLQKGLKEFFEDNDLGVVTSHNISVAIWKKDEIYYTFDSHPRDEKGISTNYGKACLLRVFSMKELAGSLEMNFSPGKEDFFNIHWVKVKLCDVEGGIVRPPLNNYTKVTDDSAILRSLYSEISTKYDINCDKQTVPMGLMALAFNKLKPAKEWTKADMDEIINKGNDFYTDTMNDILNEELKVDVELHTEGESATTPEEKEEKQATSVGSGSEPHEIEEEEIGEEDQEPEEDGVVNSNNVSKEFHIGLNRMTVDFEFIADGNIKEGLKESLKTYFDQEQTDEDFNLEAIIESSPLTVMIWRDDKAFYCFDSKPRDKNGMVIGAEDWSEYEPPAKDEDEEEEDEEDNDEEEEGGDQPAQVRQTREADYDEEIEELDDEENDVDDEGDDDDEEPAEVKVDTMMAPPPEPIENQNEDEGYKEDEEIKVPVVHKSSSFWKEQEKNGKACVMWFTKLDDLVNHIYDNISPKDSYLKHFTLKSVQIINNVVLKERLKPDEERNDVYGGDWYEFREVDHGKWIMRGSMNLMNEMFPEENRGKQQNTAGLVALALAYVFSMLCFDRYSVDTILTYGDKLYTFMKRMRKKHLKDIREVKLSDEEIEWLVHKEQYDLRDVVKKLCIWKFYVDINVEQDYLRGDINSEVDHIFNVERGLREFFSECKFGLLECKGITVAIWRGEKVYFMFDGMNRGPNGIKSPNGTGCITRFLELEDMSNVFLANLPLFGKNYFMIHKVTMWKDLCPRVREAKELRDNPKQKGVPKGGFHRVVAGKCIVRGNLSLSDPKFTQSPTLLSAPIAVVALTMSLIHKPNTWSKPIVDDILELGAELSEDSMAEMGYDFNPWEDTLDISRVKNDYNIGVLKANCEFRSRDQRGVIDSKKEYVLNLRQGIEQFFEENTHGVLSAANLILAIWEEEDDHSDTLIYMFDPNPRGPTGMPLDTGTACVMTFVNAKVLADHILGCILDPQQKMGDFTIVPVEIVVGNARTKTKVKKTSPSEVAVLPRCSKLVADEEKRTLRRIAANERKRKQVKELQKIGRNGFYVMKSGDAILRGYRSQNSQNYNENSRNNQDIANCIVAIVMHTLIPIDNWTSKYIDLILDTGDQLYIDSYIAYGPNDKKLGLENIMRKFFLNNLEIHVTVYKPIISDIFNVSNLNKVLSVYFQQESYCMLNYIDQWVSIFTKMGFYYVFDPHERNIEGNPVNEKEEGNAVVLKFDNLNSTVLKLVQNLYVELETSVKQFSLWLISVENK